MMNATVADEEEVPSGQSVSLKNTTGDAAGRMRSTPGDAELLPQLTGAGPVTRSCDDVDEGHPTDVCYNTDKEEKPHGPSASCCGSSTSVTSHDSPCSLGSVVEVKDLQEDVLLPCTWHDVDESPTVLTEGALAAAAAARASSVESDKARRRSLEPAAAPAASSSSFRQRLQAILYHKNQEIASRLQYEIVSRLRQHAEDPTFEEEKHEGGRLLPSSPRSPPLVLVSGALGSGKSYLARSIRTAVHDELGGYVVTGRCCEGSSGSCGSTSGSDERKDGIINPSVPYPVLVSALEEFASAVLRRGPNEVARIRDAVQASLGIETFVLSRFMPSLREILGARNDEPSPASLHATDSKETTRPNRPTLSCDSVLRFAYVFENFVRAISSPEHPVVMVLDDLHDCDPCSLCVLRSVLASAQSNSNALDGFLVVGTLQPDRVPCDSVLASTLRALEDVERGIEIAHFPLLELDSSEIHEAVSNAALGKASDDVQELADHIYRCTAGNPYHVSELVAYMEDCGYVTSSDGCWSWDKEGIAELRACAAASTMLDDLISRKLSRLTPECREALQVASCLGFYIDEELIGFALGYSVLHVLREGEASGLLSRDRWGLHAEPRYRFANAAVRRAAKDLIPSDSQASFQLEMARRIWKRCDEASAEKHLYTVIALFEKGKCLIERPSERHAVASLCYHAGVMAARSSSFRVASEHFDLGLQILGPNRWRENYELSLSLCNAASEMGMCTGNFASMEAHLSDVLTHARVYRDTIQARATKIYYYGTSAAYQADAVREGIEVLNELGIDVPPRASKIRLALELRRVRKNLKGRTDSTILRMPTLVNAEKRSCLQILSLVYQNAMFARPDLLPIVILRMIDITLQYGLSEFASLAFANYGALCVEVNGDVEMGYRYGSLGLAILGRFNANELVPRVYGTFYKHIHVHTKPVKDTLQPLAKAYRIGLYTGDLDAAFLCAIYFCVNCFDTGHPLPALEAEYSDIIRRMEASRQKSMLTTALPLAQCIRDLMGLSDDPLSASGDLINHDELMKTSEEAGRPLVVSTMLACRLTLCNVLNEFEFVSGFLHEFVTKYLDLIPPGSTRTCMKMSVALCAIELARLGRHRRRNVRIVKSMIASLRKYADLNPHFCLDKLYLVQAELASYQRDWSRARQKYLSAVALSSANESLYSAAKANECYARHLLRGAGTDDPEFARDSSKYFVEACRLYREWGAAAKVKRLQREVKELFPRLDFQVASKPAARPSLKSINLLEYSFLGL